MFDGQGKIVVDTDANKIPQHAPAIAELETQLGGLWPPHKLTLSEKVHVITAVKSVISVIAESKRGGGPLDIKWQDRKLVPACQHPVKEGMIVLTREWNRRKKSDMLAWLRAEMGQAASAANVKHQLKGLLKDRIKPIRQSVRTLVELLAADHFRKERSFDHDKHNEFRALARLLKIPGDRFASRARMPQPEREKWSRSQLLEIDHDACILCDRCIRGCTDVRNNNVIGRTGKGAETRIGFDFNVPMSESTCVECGECLISCPTSAIMAGRPIVIERRVRERSGAWARIKHDVGAAVPMPIQRVFKELLRWLLASPYRQKS